MWLVIPPKISPTPMSSQNSSKNSDDHSKQLRPIHVCTVWIQSTDPCIKLACHRCLHCMHISGFCLEWSDLSGGFSSFRSDSLLRSKCMLCSISNIFTLWLWVVVKLDCAVVKEGWVVVEADHPQPMWPKLCISTVILPPSPSPISSEAFPVKSTA